MDVSSTALLQNTNTLYRFSFLRHHSTSTVHFRRNPFWNDKEHPIAFLKIPSCYHPFVVSAHFGRPSRRRNTLRKKLSIPGSETQVRKFPESSNPDPNLQLPTHDEKQNIQPIPGELNSRKKTDLCDKLDNWIDQYKMDSEFWGIGTGPIFTICQDLNGNVIRVSINEDEVVTRSRIRAWPIEREEVAEEYKELNSKISHARMIAREIEAGERVLPRNSSIAKFVVEGKRLSFMEGLHSVSLQKEKFVKLFPQIGFTVLCVCCVFWAVMGLFSGNDNRSVLTREEAEMLRRKKKARMERAELERGSVKVIDEGPELSVTSNKRPQLDRDGLMDSITKAQREHLLLTDASSRFNGKDHDFINRVTEIREMTRQARELERQDRSETYEIGKYDDRPSVLSASNGKFVGHKNDAFAETETSKNGPDIDGLAETESLADLAADEKDKKGLAENSLNGVKSIPHREPWNMNNGNVNVTVDDPEIGPGKPMEVEAESSDHSSSSSTSSVDRLRNKEKDGQNKTMINSSGEKEFNSRSSYNTDRISVRRQLKIIRSVKDARKYLSEKRRLSAVEMETVQEVQQKQLLMGNTGSICNDKLDGYMSQIFNAGTEVIEPSKINKLQEDDTQSDSFSMNNEDTQTQGEKHVNFQYDVPDCKSEKPLGAIGNMCLSSDHFEPGKFVYSSDILLEDCAGNTGSLNDSKSLRMDNPNDEHKYVLNKTPADSCMFDRKQVLQSPDLSSDISHSSNAVKVPSGFIQPLNENGSHYPQEFDFPSNNDHYNQEPPVRRSKDDVNKDQIIRMENEMTESSEAVKQNLASLTVTSSDESDSNVAGFPLFPETTISSDSNLSIHQTALGNTQNWHDLKGLSSSETSFQKDSDDEDCHAEALTLNTENWSEKNFQKFDPIIKKIGSGFKENYMVAKEKLKEQPSLRPEISELGLLEEDGELEWMNDENLRKIVFQVRENELAGRDPFHLVDADDQRAFFEGLERKAETVNEKLLGLHEWVHSRVENLDYGADGISLYDPIEKIIPRWKGPAIDSGPVFHQAFNEGHTENDGNSHSLRGDAQSSLQKPEESLNSATVSPHSPCKDGRKTFPDKPSRNTKTLIECSDGSSRPGKQTGKEHWQHTKKWSQGFLEVYNAETDPEIKSIMKDMGKDLNRWATEKEIQDAADLLTKIPKKRRRYIEKKMKKLKQEMEMFGAPTVVSKYKEYLDEKEEDYLWWLDLRFVLCIELYTMEDDIPKVGLYSLEMAADLELNPKQYHVIAFEDPGDSKNFCYIIQAHMDMLGTGKAFVVARAPKDAFREAKANGFNVTVIRKGEMKFNVDQMLEEVEEELTEIGSKMYHDTIMRERSVDMHSLMKGMISSDRSSKRTTKQRLAKPAKS